MRHSNQDLFQKEKKDIKRNPQKAELKKQNQMYEKELSLQRQQNQTIIQDLDNQMVSSLELVNSLPNGKMQTVNSMKYHSRILQSEKKVPFKYHYLRHTYGTRCIEAGMTAVVLQRLMGHKDVSVTLNTYTSVFNKFKEDELEKVNNYLNNNQLNFVNSGN